MITLDLRPQIAINYSTNCFYRECSKPTLLLGKEKSIYLHFNLPLLLYGCLIAQARLVLFKLPAEKTEGSYILHPLRTIFNAYGCGYTSPALDCSRSVPFTNMADSVITEIDITQIIRDWTSEGFENNGLFLAGDSSPYIFYASDQYPLSALHPMLRVTVQSRDLPSTLNSAPCETMVTRPIYIP